MQLFALPCSCCCAFYVMPFPAFTFGSLLALRIIIHVAFPCVFCMSLFCFFLQPPHCCSFTFCPNYWCCTKYIIGVESDTGFCFQLFPFLAPGMLLIFLLFRFSPRPTVDKINIKIAYISLAIVSYLDPSFCAYARLRPAAFPAAGEAPCRLYKSYACRHGKLCAICVVQIQPRNVC